ncbi:MAG: hypothetical protein LBK41_09760 [Clostridiales bacterium]|jgi:hypothetical protein|nr:hypothetical protein [Clostridiales bacterium]
MRQNVSNVYGVVPVKYTVPNEAAMDPDTNDWDEILTVSVPDAGVYYEETFKLYPPGSRINLQTATDKLEYSAGENISLSLTAFGETLELEAGINVSASNGETGDFCVTGAAGAAELTVPVLVNHPGGYCRLKLTYGYQSQYYNIKVV